MKMVLILAIALIITLGGCIAATKECTMECEECKDAKFTCNNSAGMSLIPKASTSGLAR